MADVTDSTFEVEVMAASKDKVVVVDLWAQWCGPCKTLGPLLEKTIAKRSDRIILAKVDVDSNPSIAAAFKVQSIPAVFAISNQQVVSSFVGAQGVDYIENWLDQIAPPASKASQLAELGDEDSLREALNLEPGHTQASIKLAELLIERMGTDMNGDRAADISKEVEAILSKLPDTSEVRHLKALLHQGGKVQDVFAVTARLEVLLSSVRDDESSRIEYVELLEVLGPERPETAAYRKKLTATLF